MDEKLISEFKSLGCKTNKTAAVAAQVYLELCEVKRYWDVQYFYDSISESLYLTAKQQASSKISVYIPVHSSQELSFNTILKYLHLSNKHDGDVILVFVESNSTCVYYQFTEGLADVTSSGLSAVRLDTRREKIDAEIRKLNPLIQEAALCGLPLPAFINESAPYNLLTFELKFARPAAIVYKFYLNHFSKVQNKRYAWLLRNNLGHAAYVKRLNTKAGEKQ